MSFENYLEYPQSNLHSPLCLAVILLINFTPKPRPETDENRGNRWQGESMVNFRIYIFLVMRFAHDSTSLYITLAWIDEAVC